MELAYARISRAPYDEVVEAVGRVAARHGFDVLERRDIRAMLAAKGFAIAPLMIFEVEPGRSRSEWRDLPDAIVRCRVAVSESEEGVRVGALRPAALCEALLRGPVQGLIEDLDAAVAALVDEIAAGAGGPNAGSSST